MNFNQEYEEDPREVTSDVHQMFFVNDLFDDSERFENLLNRLDSNMSE